MGLEPRWSITNFILRSNFPTLCDALNRSRRPVPGELAELSSHRAILRLARDLPMAQSTASNRSSSRSPVSCSELSPLPYTAKAADTQRGDWDMHTADARNASEMLGTTCQCRCTELHIARLEASGKARSKFFFQADFLTFVVRTP